MPPSPGLLVERPLNVAERADAADLVRERKLLETVATLVERVNIPSNSSSPPGLIQANTVDPFNQSGKYALGWVYFCIILLVFTTILRLYNVFTDRVRTALHEEEVFKSSTTSSPDTDYELSVLDTDKSTNKFFPRHGQLPAQEKTDSAVSSFRPLNIVIALFRYVFYRPLPELRLRKGWQPIVFPPLGVAVIVTAALIFVALYCFLPQPYYWQSLQFGSPPLAIRSGMIAVALVPWIIALSMKANLISVLTGIGHERLNVLHRWGGYLCLFLSLVHAIPFWVQQSWDQGGFAIYQTYFASTGGLYFFGSGIAALAPLVFLCAHSMPWLRHWGYELFLFLHVPVSILFFGMMFWHCRNFLTSWYYLYATLAIWLSSYLLRGLLYLNWTSPWRLSWLIGDEASITILPENAIKITIPTQTKWRPGQYVYLRMPGVSVFENHPFTIASLCSEDFQSQYGEGYRDMVIVFRPFGGFTRRVLKAGVENGPWHTYRAFIDGPYGGMRRRMEAFDTVVLIAGGSGITALVSQLLDLIKRMRDGKAVTKNVEVIWALKRPETMEWFKEELRICREYAPPDAVRCQFFITAAKRQGKSGKLVSAQTPTRPLSNFFREKADNIFNDIADKRVSHNSTKRHSALIRAEANGDVERERELRRENEDSITALPQQHVLPMRQPSRGKGGYTPPSPHWTTPPMSNSPQFHRTPPSAHPSQFSSRSSSDASPHFSMPSPQFPAPAIAAPVPMRSLSEKRRHAPPGARNLRLDIRDAVEAGAIALSPTTPQTATTATSSGGPFDFGFPSTPTEFQKNLMRFAFLPAVVKKRDGWTTEYGRPDIPYMLRQSAKDFGRRTCVFVCGPPGMRISCASAVADLQKHCLGSHERDEIFLHAENYAI